MRQSELGPDQEKILMPWYRACISNPLVKRDVPLEQAVVPIAILHVRRVYL
jgi:hypothetical protein